MLHNTCDASNIRRSLRRIDDFTARAINDVIAFIGNEFRTVWAIAEFWIHAERFKLPSNDGQRHLNDFDG